MAPSSAFAAADISIYKDGSATQKTSTNGITVTSPFDSITGLHLVEIDTSNSTGDSGFWASGSSYSVRLVTAKTVATYSVSGLLIGEFSLELQTADIRKIVGVAQSATDLKDFADTGYDPSTHKVQGVVLVDTTTTNSDMRGTDNAALAATALSTATWTSTIAGRIDAAITSRMATYTQPTGFLAATFPSDPADQSLIIEATDAILTAVGTRLATASYTAPPAVGAIAYAVWDEARSGHTTAGTFGFYLDAAITGISAGSGATAQQVWEYATRTLTGAVELDPAVGTQIDNIENASGWLLAVAAGACANPQTATETYDITAFGINFRVAMAGQTSTGTRTAPTLSNP